MFQYKALQFKDLSFNLIEKVGESIESKKRNAGSGCFEFPGLITYEIKLYPYEHLCQFIFIANLFFSVLVMYDLPGSSVVLANHYLPITLPSFIILAGCINIFSCLSLL